LSCVACSPLAKLPKNFKTTSPKSLSIIWTPVLLQEPSNGFMFHHL
jgi:hypothetical protein